MAATALLFDLDGTLVDSARDIARALSVVSAGRGGCAIDVATVRPMVSLGVAALVASALGEVAGHSDADIADFRRVLETLPADCGTIHPGVEAALTALGEAGHKLAIVTNKPEGLSRRLLAGLAIDRHFGAIIGGDTTGFAKPHRAPVDRALAILGAQAEAAIFIGDSSVDAAAAAACGMPFLLYAGGYGSGECNQAQVAGRFDDFAALPALIATVRGAGGYANG